MATPSDPFTAFNAMLEQFKQFKLPGVDMAAVIEARRKDIEALTEANRVAYSGMQALIQKQTEMLRKTMEEMQAAAQKMATSGNPGENLSKQGEFVQQTMSKTFENMRELAEMARKSQAEALDAITKRAQKNMQEMKAMMQPK